MKFVQQMAFDFPPETTRKYLTDEGALNYMVDNNPELSRIEVLGDREEGTKRTVEMKYITDVSLPGPIKRISPLIKHFPALIPAIPECDSHHNAPLSSSIILYSDSL